MEQKVILALLLDDDFILNRPADDPQTTIYPRVLKINNGYAYGAYIDTEKQRWFMNRVKPGNESE